jgi:Ca2+-binding EF-hand superfamily protein
LHDALIKVGINPSPQELMSYFKRFDKNNDEKISLSEF